MQLPRKPRHTRRALVQVGENHDSSEGSEHVGPRPVLLSGHLEKLARELEDAGTEWTRAREMGDRALRRPGEVSAPSERARVKQLGREALAVPSWHSPNVVVLRRAVRTAPVARPMPCQVILPNGFLVERYHHGAEVLKDALGKVIEVRSTYGSCLTLSHGPDGHLSSFVHTVRGKTQSTAAYEKAGVVVRDSRGRVKARGDRMSVDPHGCLWIRSRDGQFICLDLVRELNLEHRSFPSPLSWNLITAMFAHDGFRMATRWQILSSISDKRSWRYEGRFYGRDGSVVCFDTLENLIANLPLRVLPPGSFFVPARWRHQRQAGNAWESVQEYLRVIF